MRRPPNPAPQWAYGALAGHVVAPLEGKAAAGYDADERVPAAWLNYHLSTLGEWLAFLSSPSTWQWTARTYPTPDTAYEYAFADADDVTPDNTERRYRYCVVTEDADGPCVLVSRTGAEWVRRDNLGASPGVPLGIHFAPGESPSTGQGRWYIWTDTKLLTAVADFAGEINALRGDLDWYQDTIGGSPGVIAGVARFTNYVVLSTSTKILFNDGAWHHYTIGTRQQGRAIVWTGVGGQGVGGLLVEISSTGGDGIVHTAAFPDGTWTLRPTITGTGSATSWQLALGELGEVIAYKTGTTAPHFHRSTDHGVTWVAVESTVATKLRSLRYHEGLWLAVVEDAPYALSSNDLAHWIALPLPVSETEPDLRNVVIANGAWLLVGVDGAFQGAPAIDPAPGGYTPGTRASTLANAGFLQGEPIGTATPTAGQTLGYFPGYGWLPTTVTPGGGSVSTRTATYTAVAGDVVLCDATAGVFTVTLPTAAAAFIAGRSISVKKVDSSGNAVTVDGNGAEAIDGAANLSLSTQYAGATFWSDGFNWWVF